MREVQFLTAGWTEGDEGGQFCIVCDELCISQDAEGAADILKRGSGGIEGV